MMVIFVTCDVTATLFALHYLSTGTVMCICVFKVYLVSKWTV